MDAYVYQAELLCRDCAEQVMEATPKPVGMDPNNESTWDSDEYPKGPYPNGGGESDYPQYCGHCGTFLQNPLTEDGQQLVQKAIEEEDGDTQVLHEWSAFYGLQ